MEELKNEKQSSISLTKNSKGYTWDIKLYFEDDADKTLAEIERINNLLKRKYDTVVVE